MADDPVSYDPERIAGIEQRAGAATDGPWEADVRESWDMVVWAPTKPDGTDLLVFNVGQPVVRVGDVAGDCDEANAHFIAHARTDIPYLLSVIQGMKDEFAVLQEEVRRLQTPTDFFDADNWEYTSEDKDIITDNIPEGGILCMGCLRRLPDRYVAYVPTEWDGYTPTAGEFREFDTSDDAQAAIDAATPPAQEGV